MNLRTKAAELSARQTAWQNAHECAEKHVRLGLALQGQGGELLRNAQQQSDVKDALKLAQQAMTTIERGVKIEREARDKIIDLLENQPK